MTVPRLTLIALTALLALATLGCGDDPMAEQSQDLSQLEDFGGLEDSPRLVLIGVDGIEPQLLRDLVEAGRLPTFERLIQNGSLAEIQCVAGMTSPVVWTTIATGQMPQTHGVTGFTIDGVPFTSTVRRSPAFWNILHQSDVSIATIGWMVTWPAETDGGVIISDRAHWGQFESKMHPADLVDLKKYRPKKQPVPDFLSDFTSYPFDPKYESLDYDDPKFAPNFLLKRRLIEVRDRDAAYTEMARDVLAQNAPEILALYLQGIDYTGHGFWKWFEPELFLEAGWTIDPENVERLKDVIPLYYEYTDALIAKTLEAAGGDPLVIVLSDHGFGARTDVSVPAVGEKIDGEQPDLGDFISGNHRNRAALIVSGGGAKRGAVEADEITHLDILPTVLYALGIQPPPNLAGRVLDEFLPDLGEARIAAQFDEKADGDHAPVPTEHDEEILDELRSLGYVK